MIVNFQYGGKEMSLHVDSNHRCRDIGKLKHTIRSILNLGKKSIWITSIIFNVEVKVTGYKDMNEILFKNFMLDTDDKKELCKSKTSIKDLLDTDKFPYTRIGVALSILFSNQTLDERIFRECYHANGIGFGGSVDGVKDVEIGSIDAIFYLHKGFLTEEQGKLWQVCKINAKGWISNSRINKYSEQITRRFYSLDEFSESLTNEQLFELYHNNRKPYFHKFSIKA